METKVSRVLVGSGANTGTGALPNINLGDLFIYDKDNNLIDTVAKAIALSASDPISIVGALGRNKNVIFNEITGTGISNYRGKSFVAPQEKVILIGSPAGGGINVTSGEEYRLRIYVKEDQKAHCHRMPMFDVNYPASNVTTQEGVASFVACIYGQEDYGHSKIKHLVKLERVADGTFTALTNDATVTYNSDIVTSTAHGVTVGSKVSLRLGGTTINDAVYLATATDANTFKLDAPYVGESDVILAANALTATDSANWGFKLTGVPQESPISRAANEPTFEYEWIDFEAVFSQAEDRAVNTLSDSTVLVELNQGQGFWKQVADREELAKGYWGDVSKMRYHDRRINSLVDPTKEYDSIVITHRNTSPTAFQNLRTNPLQLEIYIPTLTDQGDETPANNKFLAILNAYMVNVLKFAPITF